MPREHNPRTRRVHRYRRVGWALFAFLVVVIVGASVVSVPYEAITPGSTVNVAKLISVPKAQRHYASGSVSLVDVNLVPLRAIDYLFFRLNGDNQVVPQASVLGSESQQTYDEQGVLDMLSAQQAATYVALRELGYSVKSVQRNVVVYATVPGSPAAPESARPLLRAGDIIAAINGHAIANLASMKRELSRFHPGTKVTFSLRLYGQSKTRAVPLVLGVLTGSGGANDQCRTVPMNTATYTHSGSPCLGVVLMPIYRFANIPFAVNLSAEGIIGPSAGLAFTLGLIKELDAKSLTGGRQVAATGTIGMDGAIGDVGGVAQKTIAVQRSGATVFFVPKVEFRVAVAHAGTHLKVFPVSTISQVIHDLEGMGGGILKRVGR